MSRTDRHRRPIYFGNTEWFDIVNTLRNLECLLLVYVEPVEKPPVNIFFVRRLNEMILVGVNRLRVRVGTQYFVDFMSSSVMNSGSWVFLQPR